MSDGPAQEAAAAVQTDVEASPHGLLRQAREASGLNIAALAAALKVPVKKLEALEAGRFDELPDMVFARALASSACRQLKVDPGPILQQIPASGTPQVKASHKAINAPFKSASLGAPTGLVGWLSLPAVLAAIALMLAALVLVFLPEMVSTVAPTPDVPVVAAVSNEAEPAIPKAAAPDTAASGRAQVISADVSGTGAAPVPQVVATSPVSIPEPGGAPINLPSTPAGSNVLSIRATGESWVEVTNNAGEVMAQRLLKSGEVVDFSAPPPYAVIIGSAENAIVLVRGLAFDPTPFVRAGVARFEVK